MFDYLLIFLLPEVDKLEPVVGVEHDIFWLDISMYNGGLPVLQIVDSADQISDIALDCGLVKLDLLQ